MIPDIDALEALVAKHVFGPEATGGAGWVTSMAGAWEVVEAGCDLSPRLPSHARQGGAEDRPPQTQPDRL